VDEALAREGELTALVRYTHMGGARDWFIIQNQSELERVLAKVGVRSPTGPSDAISLLPTHEFPYRGSNLDDLRVVAKEIASRSWVIVAHKRESDPQLYDDFAAEDPDELDAWFDESGEGAIIVGEDPYVRDREIWPAGDEFLAYAVRPDGTALRGVY
jgi:hypothetical protein